MGLRDRLRKASGDDDGRGLTDKVRQDAVAAGRVADEAGRELKKRAGADARAARRAATPENAKAVARRAGAAAIAASENLDETSRGRGATSREKQVAARAEAAATAGPIYDTSLNPTNDPSNLQGFASGAAMTSSPDRGGQGMVGVDPVGGLGMDFSSSFATSDDAGSSTSLLFGDESAASNESNEGTNGWDDSFVNGDFE